MKRFILFALVLALFGGIMCIAPPSASATATDVTISQGQKLTLSSATDLNASLINLLNASVINTKKTLVGFSLLTHTDAVNLAQNSMGYIVIHPSFYSQATNLTETTIDSISSQAILLTAITNEWPPTYNKSDWTAGAFTSIGYDVDIGKLYTAIAPFNIELRQIGATPPLLTAEAQGYTYLGATATNDGTITLTLDDGTASPGEAYAMMTIPTITDDTANMSTDIALTGENAIYSEAITAAAAYNYRC